MARRCAPHSAPPQSKALHRRVLIASVMAFFSATVTSITFPYMQSRRDVLGCDALCQGGQNSLQSGLGLVGAALIGRASDRFGRLPMLWIGAVASLMSLAINRGVNSLEGMWLSIVPAALFDQTFSVCKALFSDYVDEQGGTEATKTGSIGMLGMAIGFSFISGPLLASLLVANYIEALWLAAAVRVVAMMAMCLLPAPSVTGAMESTCSTVSPRPGGLREFSALTFLRTHAAQMLILLRLLMALAFHTFMACWHVSIRRRFDVGPNDYAALMCVVGLSYSLSQGFVAKPLVRWAGDNHCNLLIGCCFVLGGLRPLALWTTSWPTVCTLVFPMAIALGVMNTVITTVSSQLCDKKQLGGFFGVMESVESSAGLVAPALGGFLATVSELAVVAVVASCYVAAAVLVFFFLNQHVSMAMRIAKNRKSMTCPSCDEATQSKPARVLCGKVVDHLGMARVAPHLAVLHQNERPSSRTTCLTVKRVGHFFNPSIVWRNWIAEGSEGRPHGVDLR